jgi:uncharacterized protein
MSRFTRTALAALAASVAFSAPASAEVPKNADWYEHYISTPGHPRLHVDVMLPKGTKTDGSERIPLIVSVGPYFGHMGSIPVPVAGDANPTNDGPTLRWRDLIEDGKLFERGYGLVQVDSRGFGGSSGCNDFGGIGEQADVKRGVEWAADLPYSSGKVALYGKSYDGWTGVMGLDENPKGLAASIIQSPIIDGYRTLYQDGLHYGPGWWYTPALYQAIDLVNPALGDLKRPDYMLGFATGTDPACYAQNIAFQNAIQEPNTAFWQERELPGARNDETPVFWSHGLLDINTKPDNFLPVYSTLKGPKRAWVGQFLHTRPNEPGVGRSPFYWEELFDFLAEHVEGEKVKAKYPNNEVEDSLGRWRGEEQWPPADASTHDLKIRPGTVSDRPSGTVAWSTTEPVQHTTWMSGVPTAKVDVTSTLPGAALIAQLYDVDEDGQAYLISRGGGKIRSTGQATKTLELFPVDYVLEPGHRLALRLTGADTTMWVTPPTGQDVTVRGGTLSMPFLRFDRKSFLEGEQSRDANARPRTTVNSATMEANLTEFDAPPKLK